MSIALNWKKSTERISQILIGFTMIDTLTSGKLMYKNYVFPYITVATIEC